MGLTADTGLLQDVHACLLPVILDPTLDTEAAEILAAGARILLVGETREEYVARRMSDERITREASDQFIALSEEADRAAHEHVVIALDQELGGIQRLHELVPPMPDAEEAKAMPVAELEATTRSLGEAMRGLGVGLTLAPTLDIVPGGNPWLKGRHLGTDPAANRRVGAAFVRGLKAAGVAATAKHFPGCGPTEVDPHTTEASVGYSLEELHDTHLPPFRAAVDAGVQAAMLGPVVVESLDQELPASLSPAVVDLLRSDLGFGGVIITDDLDSRSNARGRAEAESAVLALQAGADLLLVGLVPSAREVAAALVDAVTSGRLERARVADAAARVRALAQAL
jgi:beta-N-acetylhexosaminidase